MKTLSPAIWFFLAASASLAAADVAVSSASTGSTPAVVAPQLRPRLDLSKVEPTAKAEPAATPASAGSSAGVLVLDKVTVTDMKLAESPKMPPAPDPKTFSATEGGALHRTTVGELPTRIGIWRYTDVMADDANFKTAAASATLVRYELAGIKF